MPKNLVSSKKSSTFAPAFEKRNAFGTLDERFSPRSAKPVSAVRLRKVPLKKITGCDFFVFYRLTK